MTKENRERLYKSFVEQGHPNAEVMLKRHPELAQLDLPDPVQEPVKEPEKKKVKSSGK